MGVIYVLFLEKNKYYIGEIFENSEYPNYPDIHFENNGTSWTKTYKPLYISEYYDNKLIDDVILKYIKIHGINNVRGGLYQSILLTNKEKKTIKEKLYDKYYKDIVKEVEVVDINETCMCKCKIL